MTATDHAPPLTTRESGPLTKPAWWHIKREPLIPILSFAAMLLVGLGGLDRGSMWQDESATFEVAHRSIGQILAMLRHVDVVHGLYYLVVHVWLLPGGGEVWMRVPSVIAMAVAAGAVAALGTRLAGPKVGLVAGLLFSAAPLASFYAQEGRSTALVTAAVLTATVLLVTAAQAAAATPHERRAQRIRWIGYAAAMAVAVALHEFAILALVAHATTLLLNRARAAIWIRWLAVAAGCGALVLPIAILSEAQSRQVSWLARPDGQTLTGLGAQIFGTNAVLLAITLPLVLIALISDARTRTTPTARTEQGDASDESPGWRPASRQSPLPRWTVSSVAVPLLLAPLVVLLGVSLVQPLFHIRYVLFVLAAVPLLTARGIAAATTALMRGNGQPLVSNAAPVVVVAALVTAQLPQLAEVRTIGSRNNDLAAAAHVVGANSRPGDAVIFMPLRFRAATLAYPNDFTSVDDIALDKSGIEAANLRGIDRSRPQVSKAMLARDRIWVVGRSNLAVRKGEKGAENEQAVLKAAFTKTATYTMHGMQVALYERKPSA